MTPRGPSIRHLDPRRRRPRHGEDGFTLPEMVIASALMLVITGVALQLLDPAAGAFAPQAELLDMQQRLRVGIEALRGDLSMAGAGISTGTFTEPLVYRLAAILPFRSGLRGDDPAAGVLYRGDTISVIDVPHGAAQATATIVLGAGGDLDVDVTPNCAGLVCGFTTGTRVLIVSRLRAVHDVATITDVRGSSLHLQTRGSWSPADERTPIAIAEVATHTYYLKQDARASTYQLMHYDGDRTDQPVADDVVALAFDYYGDPQPPQLRGDRPLEDPAGPWTTYGPKPPMIGVDDPEDSFGAGESCLFTLRDGNQVPRLATLAAGVSPVRLEPATLSDGPFCPDAGHAIRFDADALRIRRVRVTLRVQAAKATLRGPAGLLFTHGGIATRADRYIPDQEIRFDVSPRNLNVAR
jgi:prepilin-type N-terminal cleavage/methylation domain-containing protein